MIVWRVFKLVSQRVYGTNEETCGYFKSKKEALKEIHKRIDKGLEVNLKYNEKNWYQTKGYTGNYGLEKIEVIGDKKSK